MVPKKKSGNLLFQSVLNPNLDEPLLYRYYERRTATGVELNLVRYRIVRYTPKGVWVTPEELDDSWGKNFVLLKARKKFAHFTQEEALVSLKARKRRQIQILKKQLANAEAVLYSAENLLV